MTCVATAAFGSLMANDVEHQDTNQQGDENGSEGSRAAEEGSGTDPSMQSYDPSYKKANTTTVSFGYFRTKDGKPPKTPEKK